MNLNLKMIDIPTEDLGLLLPLIVIEDALEGKSLELTPSSSSYRSYDHYYNCCSPEASIKSPLTPSPQIAPLESRLHTYLFKKQRDQNTVALKLASLFDEVNFEKEVEKEVAGCVHRVSLCDELSTQFFEEVVQKITLFANSNKKLNAMAKSFDPNSFNKENVPPQSFISKLI